MHAHECTARMTPRSTTWRPDLPHPNISVCKHASCNCHGWACGAYPPWTAVQARGRAQGAGAPARVTALQLPHPGAHVLEAARDLERHAAAARHQDAGIVGVQRRARRQRRAAPRAPAAQHMKLVHWGLQTLDLHAASAAPRRALLLRTTRSSDSMPRMLALLRPRRCAGRCGRAALRTPVTPSTGSPQQDTARRVPGCSAVWAAAMLRCAHRTV